MRDGASDTSAAIIPFPNGSDRDPLARAGHDVMTMLRRPAVAAAENLQPAVADKLSVGRRDAEGQTKELEADIWHGERSQDTLELLRKLARTSSSDDRTRHTQAAHPGAAPPGYRTLLARMPTARRPTRRQTALLAIIGCSAVLAAGVTVFLWSRLPAQDSEPRIETSTPVATPSEPAAVPTQQARADLSSVQTAMAECDLEAAKNPFTLYFLAIPIVLGSDARQSSERYEEDYESYSLMPSQAMLDGLRDRSLVLASTPFRYAIIDSATGTTKTWSTATGMSKFTHDTTAFSKFRVRFGVAGKDPKWSNEYPRRVGECYWVNVRLR